MLLRLFLIGMLTLAGHATAARVVEVPIQRQIDDAFTLILRTRLGRAVCHDLLGKDAKAIEYHLGVSAERSRRIAEECTGASPSAWLYPTAVADIRKLTLRPVQPRHYKLVISDRSFPIESWTDARTNTTTIFTESPEVSFPRLVQVLAHEMAIYFDSKYYPAHPGRAAIPELNALDVRHDSQMNPLVAVSNPLTAPTLAYLRALVVEFQIVDELVTEYGLEAPADFHDPVLRKLISADCGETCIQRMIESQRQEFMPLSLPLLAAAAPYRGIVNSEFPHLQTLWTSEQWKKAQFVLNGLPEELLGDLNSDVGTQLAAFYRLGETNPDSFRTVASFLDQDLWPLEWPAIFGAKVEQPDRPEIPLLIYLKRPLLSGYNVLMTSGPRVRIRGGMTE